MSLTANQLARIGEKKIFHELDKRTPCRESSNQTFLGSGAPNESNSHQLGISCSNVGK